MDLESITGVEVRARCVARKTAHAPGPTWLRRHYWMRALTTRPEPQAPRPRLCGAGVITQPPEHSLSFSIPAQTARAHGILAQRAPGYGGVRAMVRLTL